MTAHPKPLPTPLIGEVFNHAAEQIAQAVGDLWPDASVELGEHIPSATAYVQRVRIGDRPLIAKVSFLGISLVSLLRGARGDWTTVREAQQTYVTGPGSLVHREAAQLQFLTALGRPHVCRVAGVSHGVMFTGPVNGPTLADLLLLRPADTAELLATPLDELRDLHRLGSDSRSHPLGADGCERSIAGTFLRKFNGINGRAYLSRLGLEQCAGEARDEVVGRLGQAVARLHRLRRTLLPAPAGVLAFGDLKPEHVHFPSGPDARPVLLDPGLVPAAPIVDTAKLVSRTALLLAAHRPSAEVVHHVIEGLSDFAEARTARLSSRSRRVWLHQLLVLWLMDTVNILSTYLSAPASLPLPSQAARLVQRAVEVSNLAESVSADLVTGAEPHQAWERMIDRAAAMAS